MAQETGLACVGASWTTYNKRHYCNEPQKPQCKCTNNASGILTDATGTYCTQYSEGIQLRKWDCENSEEWSNYKKSSEKFEKNRAGKV